MQTAHYIFATSGSVVYTGINSANKDYNILIQNSTFIDNSASYQGVIYTIETKVTISESKFLTNNAVRGGVLSSISSDVIVSRSYFYGNRASTGGVLYFLPSESNIMKITNSSFEKNQAHLYGAVLYSEEAFDIAIDTSTFTDNKAAFDKAIYVLNCWSIHASRITDSTKYAALAKKPCIYFTNNKGISTLFRTYKNLYVIGDISNDSSIMTTELTEMSKLIRIDQESKTQYIYQEETPFASGIW